MKTDTAVTAAKKPLIDCVADEMRAVGLFDQVNKFYYTDSTICSGEGFDDVHQRMLLNRYFMIQLHSKSEVNTLKVRYSLLSDGEISDWMLNFKSRVLPFCVEHGLPAAI